MLDHCTAIQGRPHAIKTVDCEGCHDVAPLKDNAVESAVASLSHSIEMFAADPAAVHPVQMLNVLPPSAHHPYGLSHRSGFNEHHGNRFATAT
jgi:hypothetical protein